MRRIITLFCVVSLCFLIVFPVSAETPLLWYDYDFNGVNMDLVYLNGSDEYGSAGFNNIYNFYEASKGFGVRHFYYIMQKAYVPSEPYSLGYVLYMYQAESEEPYPFTYDGYRILARGDLYVAAYVLVSGLEGHGWKFLADDHYDAGSYLMTPEQVFWTSDDILSADGSVAIGGDEFWKEVRIDDAYTPEEDPDNPEDSTDSLLGSILAWLRSIRDGILDIPDAFLGAIGSLVTQVLDGIKAIFVPDMDEMRDEFVNLVNRLNPSTYDDTGTMSGIENATSKEPLDMVADIKLGNSVMGNLTFSRIILADYDWLKIGVDYFRPIINGMIAWLLGMFYYKEFLSFVGQAPNMAQARANAESHIKAEQKKASKNKG